MNRHLRNILIALACFLLVAVLNFLLPRMLPGDPVAYLSGFAEEDMTPAKYEYYREALHLDEGLFHQFLYYLKSLADGTLGYSFKKEAVVSAVIGERIGATLQIALPSVILSSLTGLAAGLYFGTKKDSLSDKTAGVVSMVLNAMPGFLLALLLLAFFSFRLDWFPYSGLSRAGMFPGRSGFLADRIHHLVLPVLTLTLGILPSRFLMVRNNAAKEAGEKYVLYARQRGLSERRIRYCYIFRNIAQPFITMTGMSVSLCVGGSLVVENIFSINGMGKLLTDAVYTLDYPLMQGILFVSTAIMVAAVIVTDVLCIIVDPRQRVKAAER